MLVGGARCFTLGGGWPGAVPAADSSSAASPLLGKCAAAVFWLCSFRCPPARAPSGLSGCLVGAQAQRDAEARAAMKERAVDREITDVRVKELSRPPHARAP